MGVLRLFLALCVVSQHFNQPFGITLLDAGTAVCLFFIVSGFYMAMVLSEKYTGRASNLTFWRNRALRLWPAYAISILITLVLGHYSGSTAAYGEMLSALPSSSALLIAISQVTGLGQDLFSHLSFTAEGIHFAPSGIDPSHNGNRFLLNFPAWSISIEVLFYLIAPFFVRSLRGALSLFAIGIGYCFLAASWMPDGHRLELYFPYTCVFFGLGVLAYWLKRLVVVGDFTTAAMIGAVCCVVVVVPIVGAGYLCLCTALMIPLLFQVTRRNKFDAFLGDLSYPVYILQIPILNGAPVFGHDGATLFGAAAVLIVSIVVVLFVERPIDRVRQINARHARRELHLALIAEPFQRAV